MAAMMTTQAASFSASSAMGPAMMPGMDETMGQRRPRPAARRSVVPFGSPAFNALSDSAKKIYAAIEGFAYPEDGWRVARCRSLSDLADEALVHQDTARRAVGELMDAGWIARTKDGGTPGRAHSYYILWHVEYRRGIHEVPEAVWHPEERELFANAVRRNDRLRARRDELLADLDAAASDGRLMDMAPQVAELQSVMDRLAAKEKARRRREKNSRRRPVFAPIHDPLFTPSVAGVSPATDRGTAPARAGEAPAEIGGHTPQTTGGIPGETTNPNPPTTPSSPPLSPSSIEPPQPSANQDGDRRASVAAQPAELPAAPQDGGGEELEMVMEDEGDAPRGMPGCPDCGGSGFMGGLWGPPCNCLLEQALANRNGTDSEQTLAESGLDAIGAPVYGPEELAETLNPEAGEAAQAIASEYEGRGGVVLIAGPDATAIAASVAEERRRDRQRVWARLESRARRQTSQAMRGEAIEPVDEAMAASVVLLAGLEVGPNFGPWKGRLRDIATEGPASGKLVLLTTSANPEAIVRAWGGDPSSVDIRKTEGGLAR